MGMVHGMESDEMRMMLEERQWSHAAGMDFQMKLSLKVRNTRTTTPPFAGTKSIYRQHPFYKHAKNREKRPISMLPVRKKE